MRHNTNQRRAAPNKTSKKSHLQRTASLKPSHSRHISISAHKKTSIVSKNKSIISQPQRNNATTFRSIRKPTEQASVLLAGYYTHFGQHLYHHLRDSGFSVIPLRLVDHNRGHSNTMSVLTDAMIQDKGLPDLDFIINALPNNLYEGKWDSGTKHEIEASRIKTSEMLSNAIRDSDVKPYAFVNISSTQYYPPSDTKVYTESYQLPDPPRDATQAKHPAMQAQEMSIPYLSRLARDTEWAGRVFQPENDYRTAEQVAELKQRKLELYNARVNARAFTDENKDLEGHQLYSHKQGLLNNHDVRVINFRHGQLLSPRLQEWRDYRNIVDWGLLSHLGSGEQVTPWIHVDDATRLLVHCMTTPSISGAVNAVAPDPATNKQITKYMAKAGNYFTQPFGLSRNLVVNELGDIRAGSLLDTTMVHPSIALDTGYRYIYPNIDYTTNHGGIHSEYHNWLTAYGTDPDYVYSTYDQPLLQ